MEHSLPWMSLSNQRSWSISHYLINMKIPNLTRLTLNLLQVERRDTLAHSVSLLQPSSVVQNLRGKLGYIDLWCCQITECLRMRSYLMQSKEEWTKIKKEQMNKFQRIFTSAYHLSLLSRFLKIMPKISIKVKRKVIF